MTARANSKDTSDACSSSLRHVCSTRTSSRATNLPPALAELGLGAVSVSASLERVTLEYPMRRASVHAGQGGPIVGYHSEDVGYIPADIAADFDPEPVRAASEGCDDRADPGC